MSLVDATRAETTKQLTTTLWWLLAIVLFLYIGMTAGGLGFVFAATSSGNLPGEALGGSAPPPVTGLAELLYSTATAMGYVFPVLVGTLMVTTEIRHQTLTPTFLATPRRGRALGAKLAVGAMLGVVYAIVGIIASVVPSAAFLALFGVDTALGESDTWALFGRMVIAYVIWVLVGIGVGALVRNQVGAIVGILVFTQFIEPIVRLAASFVDGMSGLIRFLPGAAGDALVGASLYSGAFGSTGDGASLAWWAGGLVLLGYGLVLSLLGYLTSWRRDVV